MTYGAGMGIALQPTSTTAVDAAVHSRARGKVTILAALKTNQKEARVSARKKPGWGIAARHRRWFAKEFSLGDGRKKRRKYANEPIYGQISSHLGL